jgi:hypothetical protein
MRFVVCKQALAGFWNEKYGFKGEPLSGEEWKRTEVQIETSSDLEADSEGIELPFPFKDAGFRLFSNDGLVSYSLDITFLSSEILEKASLPFKKFIQRSKKTFYPTTDNLTGYLLDVDSNPWAVIRQKKLDGLESRAIDFGRGGARPRTYTKLHDLQVDINESCAIANSLLNFYVSRHNKLTKKRIRLPHMDVYFNSFKYHYDDD